MNIQDGLKDTIYDQYTREERRLSNEKNFI